MDPRSDRVTGFNLCSAPRPLFQPHDKSAPRQAGFSPSWLQLHTSTTLPNPQPLNKALLVYMMQLGLPVLFCLLTYVAIVIEEQIIIRHLGDVPNSFVVLKGHAEHQLSQRLTLLRWFSACSWDCMGSSRDCNKKSDWNVFLAIFVNNVNISHALDLPKNCAPEHAYRTSYLFLTTVYLTPPLIITLQ